MPYYTSKYSGEEIDAAIDKINELVIAIQELQNANVTVSTSKADDNQS